MYSVADPDPGSGNQCFLTPGSGMKYNTDPGSGIPDKHLEYYFQEPNSFLKFLVINTQIFCQFSVVDPDRGWKNPDPG
jgi:hypothetical protein